MAFDYPDIMNDVLDAGRRFESGAVQFLAELPDGEVGAGGLANVNLVLQCVLDVPVEVGVHVELPALNRRLRRLPQPLFQLAEADLRLTLSNGEVGQLTIPVRVSSHVPAGEYELSLKVASRPTEQGMRIRQQRGERRVGDIKIRHPQGLGIAQISPWGYESEPSPDQTLQLVISEQGDTGDAEDAPSLRPQFRSVWTPEDWSVFARARKEANDRRIYTVPALTPQELFIRFMKVSQAQFGDCGITLHVGEAVFLAKILTHTVTYLISQPEWQDCLLVPLYAYALLTEQQSDDPLWLVTELGYTHVVELAIALSFGLVEEVLGRIVWSPAEQRAVRQFVAYTLGDGRNLPAEFLYLPLLLGATTIADQVSFEGEEVTESLQLLVAARAQRAEALGDEDLRDLADALDRVTASVARRLR